MSTELDYTCVLCKHTWIARSHKRPRVCPKCNSSLYDGREDRRHYASFPPGVRPDRQAHPKVNQEELIALMSTPARFLSLDKLGQYYGVSRERIRQILQAHNLDVTKPHVGFLSPGACLECGASTRNRTNKLCSACMEKKRAPVQVRCTNCDKIVLVPRRAYNAGQTQPNRFRHYEPQKQWFCNKSCQGKYLARTVGFQRRYTEEQFARIVLLDTKEESLKDVAISIGVPLTVAYSMRSSKYFKARRKALGLSK